MNEWYERAKKVIPSAAQTYSKSPAYYPEPLYAKAAYGVEIIMTDDRVFTDYTMGLGAAILGYYPAPAEIPSLSLPHMAEIILAEKISELYDGQMVKFFKNGSDATEIAVRLARAYTGRDVIVTGGYHGFHDWCVVTYDRNKGVPYLHNYFNGNGLFPYSYNIKFDIDYDFTKYVGGIAGIIIEPTHPYVKTIVEKAKKVGALVIFDEVVTGFRYHLKGYQHMLGIKPDITCLGKAMANGSPLSAVVAREEIMMQMDTGNVFASSTFGGELVSIFSALQTIESLSQPVHKRYLWDLGKKWMDSTMELVLKYDLSDIVEIIGDAPRCGVKFPDMKWQSLYQQELMKHGILTLGWNNFSLSHTNEHIDKYLEALDKTFAVFKEAKEKGFDGILTTEVKRMFKR